MTREPGREWVPFKHLQAAHKHLQAAQAENAKLRAEVERLRLACDCHPLSICANNKQLRAEIERLRAGIQAFLDGDWEPKVKKMDKCPHGQYGYESCEACIEIWFQRLLENKP